MIQASSYLCHSNVGDGLSYLGLARQMANDVIAEWKLHEGRYPVTIDLRGYGGFDNGFWTAFLCTLRDNQGSNPWPNPTGFIKFDNNTQEHVFVQVERVVGYFFRRHRP